VLTSLTNVEQQLHLVQVAILLLLHAGASQTGFGRTGTVDWDTTAKTASFTAVSGNGYFVNTTSGAITVTMPASPSAGDIVGIKDYAGTFQTNNCTVDRNGSNFDGAPADAILNTTQLSVFFVYVDGTQGWKSTQSDSGAYGKQYVAATGGCVSTIGDYKYHVFTGPGTFCVSCAGNPAGSSSVDALVVAGGGAGLYNGGGGGGAGGFRNVPVAVSVTAYPIAVGGGGPGGCTTCRPNGSDSTFSTVTSAGGGAGGNNSGGTGANGGSGGGAGGNGGNAGTGGTGNTPPVTPPQGNPGGSHGPVPNYNAGAGGGGSSQVGQTAPSPGSPGTPGGHGGNGTDISTCFPAPLGGSPAGFYAGGGGGGGNDDGPGNASPTPNAPGGGGYGSGGGSLQGGSGTANTGGGGGGAPTAGAATLGSGSGGSGIVILKYKFQN
jgi:hypothetical protein